MAPGRPSGRGAVGFSDGLQPGAEIPPRRSSGRAGGLGKSLWESGNRTSWPHLSSQHSYQESLLLLLTVLIWMMYQIPPPEAPSPPRATAPGVTSHHWRRCLWVAPVLNSRMCSDAKKHLHQAQRMLARSGVAGPNFRSCLPARGSMGRGCK